MYARKRVKICESLWEHAYIDQRGDVYGCCHNKPAKLGNIYREPLERIYNNPLIQYFRKKSLDGTLACFDSCTLLDEKPTAKTPKHTLIDYSGLRRLKILAGEMCNIRCIMCWQNHRNKEHLDFKRFIAHVDIAPFKVVEIQGGEPLLIPGIESFFEHCAEKGKKVCFLTNGTLITDRWAEKIAKSSSWINFSINAATKKTHELINKGSRWEKVLENIQKVKRAKKNGRSRVAIIGHLTIIPQNLREIPLFLQNYKTLGFESVDFSAASLMPGYLEARPRLKATLKAAIKKALGRSTAPSPCLKRLGLL